MCGGGGGGGGGSPPPPPAPKPVEPTPAPVVTPVVTTPALAAAPGLSAAEGKAVGERMSTSLGKTGRAASILTGGRGDLSMPELRSGKNLLGR